MSWIKNPSAANNSAVISTETVRPRMFWRLDALLKTKFVFPLKGCNPLVDTQQPLKQVCSARQHLPLQQVSAALNGCRGWI